MCLQPPIVILVSYMILLAFMMNVHFCGTGQGIRFKIFYIPQAIICHHVNLAKRDKDKMTKIIKESYNCVMDKA